MQPQDEEALEAAAWRSFVEQLGDHLAGQWPAMPERLGDRYAAFIDLAVQQAGQRGLGHAAAVARYVNLWFVWGPAFHDKPGFEWALGILAAPREREWLTVHQLVQRSLLELQRLPGARIEAQALLQADEKVQARFADAGRQGAMRKPEPVPLPRRACDLEAIDLRLLEDPARQEYVLERGDWRRSAVATPAALRIDIAMPCPELIGVLSPQRGRGPQPRLQLRARSHGVCNGDVHPGLGFSGTHGLWSWAGHETRAVSWPAATREQPLPASGPGTVIGEETGPELHKLVVETCGLRDEGDPLGAQQTRVTVWPAEQWWLELQRAAPSPQAILPGPRAWAKAATRTRVECEGVPQDAEPLKRQFEQGLDAAVAEGVQKLAAAWEQAPGLASARLEATLGLLIGRMACTWGWRPGPAGLGGPAFMRLLALLELDACQAEIELGGELGVAGATARLALRLSGKQPLRQELRREAPEPPMMAVMKAAVAEWQWPFVLALSPLASDSAALLQQAGPTTGAFVGEAGLRPCTHGSAGWEWFVRLRIDAVAVPLLCADPLLGQQRFVQPLLPSLTLVDWSLG